MFHFKIINDNLEKYFLFFLISRIVIDDILEITKIIIIDVDTPIEITIGGTDSASYIIKLKNGDEIKYSDNYYQNVEKLRLINYLHQNYTVKIITVSKRKFFI
ncbi:hypothetical protein D3C76_602740 [compost metagenome]